MRKKRKNQWIKTEKLHLVDMKFYDGKKVELDNLEDIPKVVVYEYKGNYFNIITGATLPYLERVPYGNYLSDGTGYGTKLIAKNMDLLEEKGLCYVESKEYFLDEIKNKKWVSKEELEDKMLNSRLYFKDRPQIMQEKAGRGQQVKRFLKTIQKDMEKNYNFHKRVEQMKEDQVQKVKKK